MENIIKKAIEGGWEERYPRDCSWSQWDHTVLDPLFWQALGKCCGWGIEDYAYMQGAIDWLKHALRFHEINLTEGLESAIKYLEEITK